MPIFNSIIIFNYIQNKYRREISNNSLWEAFKKESGEYDFDEEG